MLRGVGGEHPRLVVARFGDAAVRFGSEIRTFGSVKVSFCTTEPTRVSLGTMDSMPVMPLSTV